MVQYNAYFKKWWQFCANSETNSFEVEPVTLLQKSFFNSYGAALSLVKPGTGNDVDIKTWLKGISRIRPNKQKYDTI